MVTQPERKLETGATEPATSLNRLVGSGRTTSERSATVMSVPDGAPPGCYAMASMMPFSVGLGRIAFATFIGSGR